MDEGISLNKTLNLIIDSVIIALSIVFVISTFIELKGSKKIRSSFLKIFISEMCYALFHILAIVFKGDAGLAARMIVTISNFIEYSFIYVIFVFFVEYIINDLKDINKKRAKIILYCFSLAGILINVVNLFFPFIYSIDSNNIYHRESLFFLPSIILVFYCILIFVFIILKRKNYSLNLLMSFLSGVILPIVGSIIQYFIYGYSFVIIGVCISTIYIFFSMLINEAKKKKEKENELIQLNNKIMLNQMNPHFLFNALSTIMYLCDEDPSEAKEAIHDFSIYLRNNLDFIASYDLINFDKEIDHIEAYLRIENRRFNNKITFIKEIEISDFNIPPLSLQTLIENSVKHGLFNKEKGTITLKTKLTDLGIIINVIDDGEGFDVEKTLKELNEEKERNSYGLKTSLERLENKLNAKINIKSEINKGTNIEIFIPKEKIHEHINSR